MNLIIISRSQEKLESTRALIQKEFEVDVVILAIDLTKIGDKEVVEMKQVMKRYNAGSNCATEISRAYLSLCEQRWCWLRRRAILSQL